MLPLPLHRPTVCLRCALRQQIRHVTLLRRPKRPYTFTQLITLSDGSTFLHRTTSPQAVLRSTKDTKNSPMWNPSSQRLHNVEEDEAGRLKRFRRRFGRGFDVEAVSEEGAAETADGEDGFAEEGLDDESLTDLISASMQPTETKREGAGAKEGTNASGKGKGKGGQK